MTIDFVKWDSVIKDPVWYQSIIPGLKEVQEGIQWMQGRDKTSLKEQVYQYFENHLKSEDIGLGASGKNFDAERTSIDTIVIHHTGDKPGMSLDRLSAIELIRLYAPYYFKPYNVGTRLLWDNLFIRVTSEMGDRFFGHTIGWYAPTVLVSAF